MTIRTQTLGSLVVCLIFLIANLNGDSQICRAQDFEQGKALYEKTCASCHGGKGEGVSEHYDSPLTGDLSIPELAKVIQETMPEGAPNTLSSEDANRLAIFVHHEFYSPFAQLRNAPPRTELSHLTTDQYRRSVLDLMSPFVSRPAPWAPADGQDARGLTRVVAQGDWGKDRKEIEKKVDGKLVWDWGDGKPLPEIDHEKWQFRWSGSLYAPVTGEYEFTLDATIRSNLFVNDESTPLIDASVVSFEKSAKSATIFLVGGHCYHIAIDASRSKEPSAKLSIEWKPPFGVRQPIPIRYLSPTWSPPQVIVSTSFPPDDRSVGYERGTNISSQWVEATITAAIEVGNKLNGNLKRWLPKEGNDPANVDHVKQWCHRWVSLALRRALSDQDKLRYVDAHFSDAGSIESGIKKVSLVTLTSPEFLYPGRSGTTDENIVANLALVYWDSLPETWMLEQAGKGQTHTPESIRGLVDHMLKDVRFERKLLRFYYEWLGMDLAKDLSKDQQRFAMFDDAIRSDMLTSLDLFLSEFASADVDLRGLFTSDAMYLSPRLAQVFGPELLPFEGFQKIARDPQLNAGFLSHPFVQSYYAYHHQSSPIHRGVFLAKRVLGRNLRPPVDAIIPISEDAAPGLSTRERVALQTSGAMCQSCHRVINPLGFAFENYDAIGRFRTEENGKPIDAMGGYIDTNGQSVEFRGVRPLADYLAKSPEVHRSMTRQMFQFFVKQPLPAFGIEESEKLHGKFSEGEFKWREVMRKVGELISTPSTPPPGIAINS